MAFILLALVCQIPCDSHFLWESCALQRSIIWSNSKEFVSSLVSNVHEWSGVEFSNVFAYLVNLNGFLLVC